MVEPGSRVGKPFGFETPEVAYGALEADSRRVRLSDRRKALVVADEAQHAELTAILERHVDLLALAPQAEQHALPTRQQPGRLAPAVAVDDGAWPGRVVLDLPACADQIAQPHRHLSCFAHPSSSATCWNHDTSSGGRKMPAARTSARCVNSGTYEARAGALLPRGSPKARPFRRYRSAPSAIRRPNASTTASTGARAKVEVRIRNSLMKMPVGGRPTMVITPRISPHPRTGCETVSPRMSSIFCVPFTCEMCPTEKKIADLVRLCMIMCNKPAKLASGPPMPKAKLMMPMCSIDE